MSTPLVSVIVPNYNYARYLAKRLDSVLGQSYRNLEVILLDDCSSDNSIEIMQRYAQHDTRARVPIINKQNSGSPYAQWQRGIQQARGKYIWIAESDDEAKCTLLERCISELESHPNAVLAKVASTLIDEDGETLAMDFDHFHRRKIVPGSIVIYGSTDFVNMQYRRNHIYNASGAVFRRDSVTVKAMSALSMRYSGDWLFWTRLAQGHEVIEINERLNRFRYHASSTTHTGAYPAFIEDITVLQTMEKESDIGYLQRLLRRYHLYRKMQRMEFSKEERHRLFRNIWT